MAREREAFEPLSGDGDGALPFLAARCQIDRDLELLSRDLDRAFPVARGCRSRLGDGENQCDEHGRSSKRICHKTAFRRGSTCAVPESSHSIRQRCVPIF